LLYRNQTGLFDLLERLAKLRFGLHRARSHFPVKLAAEQGVKSPYVSTCSTDPPCSRSAEAGSPTFPRIPTKLKRRSTGQGAKKPFDPQRPEKNMGPGWRQRPRTFAPQASVMAAGVRDDVGYEYTCFMRGGEDARLHGRFSGEEPLPCAI